MTGHVGLQVKILSFVLFFCKFFATFTVQRGCVITLNKFSINLSFVSVLREDRSVEGCLIRLRDGPALSVNKTLTMSLIKTPCLAPTKTVLFLISSITRKKTYLLQTTSTRTSTRFWLHIFYMTMETDE